MSRMIKCKCCGCEKELYALGICKKCYYINNVEKKKYIPVEYPKWHNRYDKPKERNHEPMCPDKEFDRHDELLKDDPDALDRDFLIKIMLMEEEE